MPTANVSALLKMDVKFKNHRVARAMLFILGIGLSAGCTSHSREDSSYSSKLSTCYKNRLQLKNALNRYTLEEGIPPSSFDSVVGKDRYLNEMPACPEDGQYRAQFTNSSFEVVCSKHGKVVSVEKIN